MISKHTYTEEQLNSMGDFEITIAVASKLGLDFYIEHNLVLLPKAHGVHDNIYYEPLLEYDDCMPIAVKHDFIIKLDIGRAFVGYNMDIFYDKEVSVEQPTLQRAIVYCFLMMDTD